MDHKSTITGALALALGIGLAGWFVGSGFMKGRAADRYVIVKGVSERDVTANVALWPIRFVATDNELGTAQEQIQGSHAKVMEFLGRHNIPATAVHVQGLEVNDTLANPYRNAPTQSRYIITQTLMVRTDQPGLVRAASQALGELVQSGVVLQSTGGPAAGPTYLFTQLTDLKPEMIAEATQNARRAAEQFAQDSGSQVGRIRRANQGVFVIQPRDRSPGMREGDQINKTVRVVSTIEYFLNE